MQASIAPRYVAANPEIIRDVIIDRLDLALYSSAKVDAEVATLAYLHIVATHGQERIPEAEEAVRKLVQTGVLPFEEASAAACMASPEAADLLVQILTLADGAKRPVEIAKDVASPRKATIVAA